MSQVVFLPNTSQKISMREKSLLLNYSLASKDNITLAGDFCHGKDGMNFFLFFLFVRISSFTFLFGCGVCLTLGFGNMTERRNSECHRWHIPHPFFRLSDSLFWTPDWLWQPYIGDISYEREFANEMLMSSIFFFFFMSCFFITGQQFWTFFKVTHPNSTVCNELIIPAMSLKSHTFFNQCAWNRSFLKGILFSLSIGTIRNSASIKCALINRCVAPWSAGFSVVLHLWLNISFMRSKMTQS